jgi:hypothetical protein
VHHTTTTPPRLAQVHARWVALWSRRIMAAPEQALVPLKERDALLASKHAVRSLWLPGVCALGAVDRQSLFCMHTRTSAP